MQREIRRGNHYDGIIMDPPSYGRGPGGEVWKLEEQLYGLVEMCVPVLTDDPLFFNFEFVHNGTFSVRYGVSARRFCCARSSAAMFPPMKSVCR